MKSLFLFLVYIDFKAGSRLNGNCFMHSSTWGPMGNLCDRCTVFKCVFSHNLVFIILSCSYLFLKVFITSSCGLYTIAIMVSEMGGYINVSIKQTNLSV